jgi:outer membrane immunogenic protein
MKKLLLASASVFALSAGAANAADLGPRPVYKAPPPVAAPVPFSWTGFYIGAHIGSGWGTKEWDDGKPNQTACSHTSPPGQICFATGPGPIAAITQGLVFNSSHTVNGFLGGGQIGFNYQVGWWVWGAEVQGSFADLTGHGTCGFEGLLNCSSKVDGIATFAGRLGFAVDRALIFVKGGGAWAHDKFAVTNSGLIAVCTSTDTEGHCTSQEVVPGRSFSSDRWGWMWGTGVEYAFLPNWSAKLEYDFLDLGTKSFLVNDILGTFDIRQRIHLVKFGINYHFSWGKAPWGKAPVVASY